MTAQDISYWWGRAKEASLQVNWLPTVILAQWQLETGHFQSFNFINNNNIAGQTWQSYMPLSMKGTPRPSAEGGFYIRYDDPVIGYVDFIQKNGRYANVKIFETEQGQINEIAARGWAADTEYAEKLMNRLLSNRLQGFILEEDDEMLKEEVEVLKGQIQTLLNTADAHIEKINTLEKQNNMPVPDWAKDAVEAAVRCNLIDTPDGRSHDFYSLLTVFHRKGLI
ncbi:glucosaminidase domain-containing protein [Paenibacillus sp. CGMCC 1.16610]|uniref:Mannosyl-glycoprotein endo-beta-N-acetylglucosamidase-like domain-containing protein n=1 Tax=Paenibacillus anseongense TaxID=2682845 RepID=A0ABW9U0U9_9BACL|nr:MULTISPECIES: glucosaminidase domain-containing protein [Paenibacillus]MBA2943227.1 glucosaminidase domain-containing protein [Paenibacillus sp. CGMCC 1.16610]MVQ33724.1 hypothetical protein [Paenibacillus anseongense]